MCTTQTEIAEWQRIQSQRVTQIPPPNVPRKLLLLLDTQISTLNAILIKNHKNYYPSLFFKFNFDSIVYNNCVFASRYNNIKEIVRYMALFSTIVCISVDGICDFRLFPTASRIDACSDLFRKGYYSNFQSRNEPFRTFIPANEHSFYINKHHLIKVRCNKQVSIGVVYELFVFEFGVDFCYFQF